MRPSRIRRLPVVDTLIVRLPPGALGEPDPGAVVVRAGTGAAGDCRDLRLEELAEQLDSGARVLLVLPSADVLMTRVRLTRKQAKQLRQALPYLLEENLLEAPETLWYAWGRPDGDDYPVLACDRAALQRLRDWLVERGIELAGATSDAALLAHRAPLRLADDQGVLLLPDTRQALTLNADEEDAVRRALEAGEDDWDEVTGAEAVVQALAEGVSRSQYVELLHGEMRPPRGHKAASADDAAWRPVAGLAAAVVLGICVLLGVQQWRYDKAAEAARDQAARLYKELFPQDRATARLRAQFRQRLNSLGTSAVGGSGFLELVAATGNVLAQFRSQGVTTRRLQFNEREGSLLLELQTGGYDAVEKVRKKLARKDLNAEIATAREDGDGVTARLRVGTG